MKSLPAILAVLCVALAGSTPHPAQGAAFVYQGRLTESDSPFSGVAEMCFVLFEVPVDGTPIATSTPSPASISVSSGLFTAALDFGAEAFPGADRWLEIQACTGLGAFTTLNPRQPLTPVPYALVARTALSVPGVDRHALHASDGSVTNAVFVDRKGNVGIGTTAPLTKLHSAGPESRLRLESSHNDSWTTTEYRTDAWEWHTGVGGSQVFNDLRSKYYIFDGIAGQTRLLVDTAGNVGVGTTAPQARLEVRGDVRLGPNGQFQAASGEETLRIVRGAFNADGTILTGSGFSVERIGTSRYLINFTIPFAGAPTVTATAGLGEFVYSILIQIADITAETCDLRSSPPEHGAYVNRPIHFIAVGPR